MGTAKATACSLPRELGGALRIVAAQEPEGRAPHGGAVAEGAVAAEEPAAGLVPSCPLAQQGKHLRRPRTVAPPGLLRIVGREGLGHGFPLERAARHQRTGRGQRHVGVVRVAHRRGRRRHPPAKIRHLAHGPAFERGAQRIADRDSEKRAAEAVDQAVAVEGVRTVGVLASHGCFPALRPPCGGTARCARRRPLDRHGTRT